MEILEAMSARVKALEKGVANERCIDIARERKARIEAPKPLSSREPVTYMRWRTSYGTWRITSSVTR